jgi:hypothetical protein
MSDTSANPPKSEPNTGETGFREPVADRPPTAEEEAAAERASRDVDIDKVAEHFEEMTEVGKNVKGEGDLYQRD